MLRESVWYHHTFNAPTYPALHGNMVADVAIVGGGYTGLAAALHLAKAGRKVVLCEAGRIGTGPSGRNGGQVLSGFEADLDDVLAKLGQGDTQKVWLLIEQTRQQVVARAMAAQSDYQSGVIFTAMGPRQLQGLHESASQLQRLFGVTALQMLNQQELAAHVRSPKFVGGLYYTDKKNLSKFINYGELIAELEIPEDAEVYQDLDKDKWKADKFIIKSICKFEDHPFFQDPEWCLTAVKNNGTSVKYMKNPSYDICLTAVKENGYALQYIENQTKELCLAAITKCPFAIRFVKEPTYEMYMKAIELHGHTLQYIENQTNEMCLLAIKYMVSSIKYVKNQTLEICEAAIMQNGLCLRYIKEKTPYLCLLAVEENGLALEYVENQTDEICLVAVNQCGNALRYVKNQTEEICLAAIENNAYVLDMVKEQTEKICSAAIARNKNAIVYARNYY